MPRHKVPPRKGELLGHGRSLIERFVSAKKGFRITAWTKKQTFDEVSKRNSLQVQLRGISGRCLQPVKEGFQADGVVQTRQMPSDGIEKDGRVGLIRGTQTRKGRFQFSSWKGVLKCPTSTIDKISTSVGKGSQAQGFAKSQQRHLNGLFRATIQVNPKRVVSACIKESGRRQSIHA